MKKKRIVCAIMFIFTSIIMACRIIYVNSNVKRSHVNVIPQGDRGTYRGVEYRVTDATLWKEDDFIKYYLDGESTCGGEDELGEKIILYVEYEMNAIDKENIVDWYIPLGMFYCFNGPAMSMVTPLNPDFSEGEFSEGAKLRLPYYIYRSNLTDEQWKQITDRTYTYTAVMGFFPERNEFKISNVKEGKPE